MATTTKTSKKTVKQVDDILRNIKNLKDEEIVSLLNNSTYNFATFYSKYKDDELCKYANMMISNETKLKHFLSSGYIVNMFETKYMQFSPKRFQEICFKFYLDIFMTRQKYDNIINQIVSQLERQQDGINVAKEVLLPCVYEYNRNNGMRSNSSEFEFMLYIIKGLGTPSVFNSDLKAIIERTLDPDVTDKKSIVRTFFECYNFNDVFLFFSEALPDYTREQLLIHLFSLSTRDDRFSHIEHYSSILHLFPEFVRDNLRTILSFTDYLEIFKRLSQQGNLHPEIIVLFFMQKHELLVDLDTLIRILKVIRETDRIVMLDFMKSNGIRLENHIIKELFITGVQTKNQALFKYIHPDIAAQLNEPLLHNVDPLLEQIGVLLQIHGIRTNRY